MQKFELVSDFQPTGDQPEAINRLIDGLNDGLRYQTLLGATGTGKSSTQDYDAKQVHQLSCRIR